MFPLVRGKTVQQGHRTQILKRARVRCADKAGVKTSLGLSQGQLRRLLKFADVQHAMARVVTLGLTQKTAHPKLLLVNSLTAPEQQRRANLYQ